MSRLLRTRNLVASVAAALFSLGASAQAQQAAVISGQVNSEQGRPLVGATVYISELNAGGLTNDAGRYSITVPAERVRGQAVTLRARFIGHTPQTRAITLRAGAQTQDFTLREDVNQLAQVVVTGVTGATERAKVPFSVSRVDSTQMPVVAVNPLNQIQGKVPGANIASTSGRPGANPSVILRGPTSINASGRGQDPLYIVDGVILSGGIADLNAGDIESVEIVKGAAAASLYGSRAGAGVIQITTKRGKATDGIRFNVRSEYGTNDIERDFGIARNHSMLMDETGKKFCVLDPVGSNATCSRVIDYRAEQARINNAVGDFALSAPSFPVDPGAVTSGAILRRAFLAGNWEGPTFNAVEQVIEPKPLTINDVSMNGRFGSTNFFSSVGHTRQAGAIAGLDGYERIAGRVNLGTNIGTKWQFSVNSFASRSTSDGSNQEEGGRSFFRLTRTPAIVDVTKRDTLGRLYIRPNLTAGGNQNENPLYWLQNEDREDIRFRYLGGATMKFFPLDWLESEANFSIDRLATNYSQFRNKGFRTTSNDPTTSGGLVFNGANNDQSLNTSAQVTIRRDLMSNIGTRFNLRYLYEQQDFDRRQIQGQALRVQDITAGANATAQQIIVADQNSTRQMSFSGGAFFDMFDRYTVDLLVRRDGSSRFGADNRWQTYGRASAAWLASRETWFPTDYLSQLTFRASYGTAGNTPSFAAQYETYTIGSGGTLTANTLGNPNLKPEVVTEVEVGTDIEVLNRYGLTVTYANGMSRNQILPVPVAVATGFPRQWQNAGTLQNQTWEASLSVPVIRQRDLTWTLRGNYTQNFALVKELAVPPFNIGTNLQATGSIIRIQEGIRYGTMFGRKFIRSCSELPAAFASQCGAAGSGQAYQPNSDGYIVWVGAGNNPGMGITNNLWNASNPAATAPWGVVNNWGMPIILRNNDGSAKQVPLGHALPDYRLGFSQNFQWRDLGVYALLDGAYGQSVWNQGRHWAHLDFLSKDLDQAGKSVEGAKPIGYYFRAPPPDNGAGLGGFYDILGPNNHMVEDASFMKLREVSASYRFGRVPGVAGDWSVSVIGRNLFTWTDYKGFDPEVGISGSGGESGSGLVNAIDAFTFPQLRSVSFVLSASF
jgi:TonB-linked SusC/RagA family outer membrane protein